MAGVLLFILKVIGCVLLALLVLALLLLICPVWVGGQYEAGNIKAHVRIFGLKINIYPPKPRKKRKPKKKKPKKQKAKAPQPAEKPKAETPAPTEMPEQPAEKAGAPAAKPAAAATQPAPAKSAPAAPEKGEGEKPGETEPPAKPKTTAEKDKAVTLTLRMALDILSAATGAMKRVIRALHIRNLNLTLPVESKDAMRTAMLYGGANAAISTALAVLHNILHLHPLGNIVVAPTFPGNEENYKNRQTLFFSCEVGVRPVIMAITAFYLYKELKKANFFALLK